MTTERMSSQLVRSACGTLVAAALSLLSTVSLNARQQPAVAWGDLTVPAGRLPEGCQLVPVAQPLAGVAVATASSQGGQASAGAPAFVATRVFPTGMRDNPWIGADKKVLAALREQVEGGGVPSPADAWWPDRRQSAAAIERAAEGIEEGYAAMYAPDISVYAVRFAPGVDRRAPLPRSAVDAAVIRIDLGPIALTVHTDGGSCAKAIVDHLRSLRATATPRPQ